MHGRLWPIPVTLDLSESFAAGLAAGDVVALRDREGLLVAILEVDETWRADKAEEARAVYGTADPACPGSCAGPTPSTRPGACGGSSQCCTRTIAHCATRPGK